MMMLIFLPCLIVLTIMVSEIGSLYVAKTELRQALEAGALGGVRTWDSSAKPDQIIAVAEAFALANTVRGKCVEFGDAGKITLGVAVPTKSGKWNFLPAAPPSLGSPAVQIEVTQKIDGNVSEVFGLTSPNYEVQGKVTARRNESEQPELISTE